MEFEKIIAVRNNKTLYRDDNKCIKIFVSGYSKADVLNEAFKQSVAEELGINVPYVYEVICCDDKWALVSEYIKGKTLAHLIEEKPNGKEKYLKTLVKLQHSINSTECLMLETTYEKLFHNINNAKLGEAAKKRLLGLLSELPCSSKLCHNDLKPSNIIIPDKGAPFVIDWENASRGDPCIDVAGTYLRLLMNRDNSGAELYLKYYCAKGDMSAEYVKKWLPLAAALLFVKSNASERAFLSEIIE